MFLRFSPVIAKQVKISHTVSVTAGGRDQDVLCSNYVKMSGLQISDSRYVPYNNIPGHQVVQHALHTRKPLLSSFEQQHYNCEFRAALTGIVEVQKTFGVKSVLEWHIDRSDANAFQGVMTGPPHTSFVLLAFEGRAIAMYELDTFKAHVPVAILFCLFRVLSLSTRYPHVSLS